MQNNILLNHGLFKLLQNHTNKLQTTATSTKNNANNKYAHTYSITLKYKYIYTETDTNARIVFTGDRAEVFIVHTYKYITDGDENGLS